MKDMHGRLYSNMFSVGEGTKQQVKSSHPDIDISSEQSAQVNTH